LSRQIGQAAGGLEWLDIWRQMYDREREQAEALTAPDFPQSDDHWKHRAAHFARISQRSAQPDGFMRFLLPLLRPDDTVLDIGAGAGRYIPLLAAHAARVIALEPSPAMRLHLEQRVADESLTNVEVVADGWPPASPVQVDVAFSAHVVYAVREIGPFLQAMYQSSRRLCVLSLMIRHINALLSPFWERFHGQARLPLPCALETCNVLYQLGFYATMERVARQPSAYVDLNEAVYDIRQKLRLSPDSRHDADLAAAVEELLVRGEDGSFSAPDQPRQAAVIWWEGGAAQAEN
jgi:SAM-dependent methyltransferase